MKRFLKNRILVIVCITMITIAFLPAYAVEDNPYGVQNVGCITDINIESSTTLSGGVNYFTSVVTSHIQGLDECAAIPYRTYGTIGSENTRMFVYSRGSANGLDYSTANVKTLVETFEAENPQWKAVAAINGDFFDIETSKTPSYGEPEFPMIQLGDVYKSDVLTSATGRGVVGTDAEGNMVYYTVGGNYAANGYGTQLTFESSYKLQLLGENRNNPICSFNAVADAGSLKNRMSFLTPHSESRDLSGTTVYVVKCDTYRRSHVGINGVEHGTRGYYIQGEVIEVRRGTSNEIVPEGCVLFFTPNPELFKPLNVGGYIKCQRVLSGEWAGVENAIGFKQQILAEGNILLKNCYGKYNTTGDSATLSWTEDIYEYPYCWKHRTAIGFREDGTPVLLVVQKSIDSGEYKGLGASYYEIGEQLKALGCINGFLLDGGGSSTMVIRNENGDLINAYKAEGSNGRAVANAIILAIRDESVEEPKEDETIEIPTEKPTEKPTSKRTEKKTDKSGSASATESDFGSEIATEEQGGCGSEIAIPALTATLVVCLVSTSVSRKKRR